MRGQYDDGIVRASMIMRTECLRSTTGLYFRDLAGYFTFLVGCSDGVLGGTKFQCTNFTEHD